MSCPLASTCHAVTTAPETPVKLGSLVTVLLGGERYDSSEPVNLGSGIEISIKDLAQKIARLTGFDGRMVWDTSKPNGQPRRCLDVRKAEERFGFRARVSFDEGLARTIDWYRGSRAKRT